VGPWEPTNFLEPTRFSGVRTFMRLPNVQGLKNPDATIVGTCAPGTPVRSTSGVTGSEMVMLMRGVASRGLVRMDIVEVAHTLTRRTLPRRPPSASWTLWPATLDRRGRW